MIAGWYCARCRILWGIRIKGKGCWICGGGLEQREAPA